LGWGGLGLVTFGGDECGCYHGGATSPDRLTDCLLMYGSATLQNVDLSRDATWRNIGMLLG